jgi:carboxypeptidase Q
MQPKLLPLTFVLMCMATGVYAQQAHPDSHYVQIARSLRDTGLSHCEAFALLQRLTTAAPHRLSGSMDAERAVELSRQMMEEFGFANVHRETVMVPVWERGPVEEAAILGSDGKEAIALTVCALGGSIATPLEGVTAEVVEVRSFDELKALGASARGKIVFFNRPLDPTRMNTFEAYGGAVDQRGGGAVEASRVGGVAALVRSMTLALDDVAHTGAMGYRDSIPKVPAAAISTVDADRLSGLLRSGERVRVRLRLTCRSLDDSRSANVIGEITGSEHPEEIVVVSGHLDCWDKGSGAHDDGAGCVQAIEVVNLIKTLGLHPKRTIRAVMFMNEENGLRGGRAYAVAPERAGEKHIAAMESDRGGFAPRGFTVHGDSLLIRRVQRWSPLFAPLLADRILPGYSGVDVSPLVTAGVPGFGLDVETHRYFDYHHSDNDTIDKVNPRELELGAVVQALMCYLIVEEGL